MRKNFLPRSDNPRALTYQPDPRGLRVAREAVAEYYSERGVAARP